MKNIVQTFAWIVSDNACGKSHLLCYTGDVYYPQIQPWEDWEVQAEEKKRWEGTFKPENQGWTKAFVWWWCVGGGKTELS